MRVRLAAVMIGAAAAVFSGCRGVSPSSPGGGAVLHYQGEPSVRVRVHRAETSLRISSPGPLVLRSAGGSRTRSVRGPLTVGVGENGVTITAADGGDRPWGWGVSVEITAAEDARGSGERAELRVGEAVYQGTLVLVPRRVGARPVFDAVLVESIEDYLPGVLAKELPHDWSMAAYQAQAVAARSYALHERERAMKEKRWYDLESSEQDQVYGGRTSSRRALEGVSSTRGIVLTSKDAGGYGEAGVLRAYFSSTCGGRNASASKVWPSSAGYEFNRAGPLQAHKRDWFCHDSPRYTWRVERSLDDVAKRLRRWGAGHRHTVAAIGRPRRLEVAERSVSLRPERYRLEDDKGRSFDLWAEDLRAALNEPVEGLPKVTRQTMVFSGDLEAEFSGPRVMLRGRGFGHGVGMCQWCAGGMAKRGASWGEILRTFYPGAATRRAY